MTDAATPTGTTILRRKRDGFDVYTRNGGPDYWRLAKACIDESIDQAALIRDPHSPRTFSLNRDGVHADVTVMAWTNPKRLVLRVDTDGKRYVVKRAFMRSPGFKRILPWVTGLTYFTHAMKHVTAAVRDGCGATQEFYLVAERWLSPFRQEVWAVLEYVEGEMLPAQGDIAPHHAALRAAATELLDHGLTMDDISPGNFLIGGDGKIRAIDVSCRPCARLQKAKMAVKLNMRYGLDIPAAGLFNRMLYALLSRRYRLRGGVE